MNLLVTFTVLLAIIDSSLTIYCPPECSSCTDDFVCDHCVAGDSTFLYAGKCEPCSYDCSICTSANTCTGCYGNAELRADGRCVHFADACFINLIAFPCSPYC